MKYTKQLFMVLAFAMATGHNVNASVIAARIGSVIGQKAVAAVAKVTDKLAGKGGAIFTGSMTTAGAAIGAASSELIGRMTAKPVVKPVVKPGLGARAVHALSSVASSALNHKAKSAGITVGLIGTYFAGKWIVNKVGNYLNHRQVLALAKGTYQDDKLVRYALNAYEAETDKALKAEKFNALREEVVQAQQSRADFEKKKEAQSQKYANNEEVQLALDALRKEHSIPLLHPMDRLSNAMKSSSLMYRAWNGTKSVATNKWTLGTLGAAATVGLGYKYRSGIANFIRTRPVATGVTGSALLTGGLLGRKVFSSSEEVKAETPVNAPAKVTTAMWEAMSEDQQKAAYADQTVRFTNTVANRADYQAIRKEYKNAQLAAQQASVAAAAA
jgi:hypothetical protein